MSDRYAVPFQAFIANGTGIITEVGRQATAGNVTFHCTQVGNFTFTLGSGCTGTVSTDQAVVTDSPKALVAGANTVVVTDISGGEHITLNLTLGTAANWNTVNSWSAASGGVSGASVPTSADNVYFNANSFTAASQVLTVDATVYCLDMDWTGATNTPTLALGVSDLNYYGNVTFILAMVNTAVGGGALNFAGTGNVSVNTNGLSLACTFTSSATTGTITLASNLTSTSTGNNNISGSIDTTNFTVTLAGIWRTNSAQTRTWTLGSSTINCAGWAMVLIANLTVAANTSTINVSSTGAFAGGTITTYNNINLNGTSHTVSGAFTCAVLTRNGTATKTDTVTFTSGTTVTCTTCAMIGNSSTNRLLVQSSTLGTAATITATNWTGTANVDIMDITVTNAVDLSAITGLSGDCGGNTGITFTTAVAQTWDGTTASWSTAARWTSRVPLPQDDVSAGGAANTITIDMPRIGKSITFTGTPTVSLSNDISNYGNYTQINGATYTQNGKTNYFRSRSSPSVTIAGANAFTTILGISTIFNILTVDRSVAAKTVTATTGTTQTVAYMVIAVSGATVVTLNGGGAWNITKSVGGLFVSDYLTILNSQALPLKTFYAGTHSTDSGGNSGWTFGNPQPVSKSGNIVQKLMAEALI